MGVLLAIDLGTEGVRVAVFGPDGERLGAGERGYPTAYPRPGWAEQHPDDWWRATVAAARGALAPLGPGPEVDAVAVATTASTVAVLDRAGAPLRPAILWMDARASAESARTAAVDHPVLRFAGGSDAAEWLVPKAMWLAGHEPETYARAHRIVEAVDYLTYRLTGGWTASRMNACCKWNYDPRTGTFPEDLYAELGVPDLRTKLPPEVAPVGAPAGELSAAARAELGVRGAAVVCTGGIDAHLSLLALGKPADGQVSIVCGTSNAFITEITEPVFPGTVWGPYPDALRTGRWLVEGGQVSAGSVLRWTGESLLGRARDTGSALIAEAAEVPPVTHGLLVLDYLMGNRTPLRDPRLRGGILGLTLGSTPAQVYRAAVEGVAYGTRHVLESFVDGGVPVAEAYLSGGIRHNPLWLQTTADVLGRPLKLVTGDNLTLRACAVLGAVAAGHRPTLEDAMAAFAPECTHVEPGPGAAVYEEGYARYLAAGAAVRDVLHELADLSGGAR